MFSIAYTLITSRQQRQRSWIGRMGAEEFTPDYVNDVINVGFFPLDVDFPWINFVNEKHNVMMPIFRCFRLHSMAQFFKRASQSHTVVLKLGNLFENWKFYRFLKFDLLT